MAGLVFPTNPVNGQQFPDPSPPGGSVYRYNASTNTWALLGPAGATGPAGSTGATGVVGPTGASGIRGATGVTGARGITGATGPRGFTGVSGVKGATGSTGPAGFNGVVFKLKGTVPTAADLAFIVDPQQDDAYIALDNSHVWFWTIYGAVWIDGGPIFNPAGISKTVWVDTNGHDDASGLTPQVPKRTIKAALEVAVEGWEIRVAPGDYYEDNPLVFPKPNMAIIGSDLRTTTIYLNNDDDLFHVLNGCYVHNFAFRRPLGVNGYGIMAFPPTGNPVITKSPYVQNCTNFVQGSIGLDVDGSKSGGLKSMVLDSFTQFNPAGIGVRVKDLGYCQVVSMYTICSGASVIAETGGTASVTNSTSDFGDYGFISDGVGPLEQQGAVVTSGEFGSVFSLHNLTTDQRPYVGQVISIGELYYNVLEFVVDDGGVGYTSLPNVTVSIGTGPSAIAAQGIAVVLGGSVTKIEVVSSGQNYKATDIVSVSFSGGGGGGAVAHAVLNPVYYTVQSSTPIVNNLGDNTCTVTIIENLPYTANPGDLVKFYRVSQILVSSHFLEYVGSGTDIATALPQLGGVPVQENEVVEINGGRIAITSTDHLGDFRIGTGLVINQNTGIISGTDFTKSILATVIPYILALK